jgi:cell division protein FtsZ
MLGCGRCVVLQGKHRTRLANDGIRALYDTADAVIVVPNQNLFNVVDQSTSFVDAFKLADEIVLEGVKTITDLIVKRGLINVDFADVRAIVKDMGSAIVGTGVARGENRAVQAAQLAMHNQLLGAAGSIKSAKGVIVNISGGPDVGLFEVDQAAQYIMAEIEDENASIIFGNSFEEALQGSIKVSIVATGLDVPQFGTSKVGTTTTSTPNSS